VLSEWAKARKWFPVTGSEESLTKMPAKSSFDWRSASMCAARAASSTTIQSWTGGNAFATIRVAVLVASDREATPSPV
jgi:hypothetical protein